MKEINKNIIKNGKEGLQENVKEWVSDIKEALDEFADTVIDETWETLENFIALKKENKKLKERLSKSVEFPHVEITPWGDTLIYYLENGGICSEIYTGTQQKALEERMKELGVELNDKY